MQLKKKELRLSNEINRMRYLFLNINKGETKRKSSLRTPPSRVEIFSLKKFGINKMVVDGFKQNF